MDQKKLFPDQKNFLKGSKKTFPADGRDGSSKKMFKWIKLKTCQFTRAVQKWKRKIRFAAPWRAWRKGGEIGHKGLIKGESI